MPTYLAQVEENHFYLEWRKIKEKKIMKSQIEKRLVYVLYQCDDKIFLKSVFKVKNL